MVSLAEEISSLCRLVFLVTRKGVIRKWWVFVGCGIVSGDFPATFYLATAPDDASLPLAGMYFGGTFFGVLAGMALSVWLPKNRIAKQRCCSGSISAKPTLTNRHLGVEVRRMPGGPDVRFHVRR